MIDDRRSHEGRIFFVTVVTHERRPMLTTELGPLSLRQSIKSVRKKHPFTLKAIVLLPEDWGSANEWYGDEFAHME